jgi:hypothetical protein
MIAEPKSGQDSRTLWKYVTGLVESCNQLLNMTATMDGRARGIGALRVYGNRAEMRINTGSEGQDVGGGSKQHTPINLVSSNNPSTWFDSIFWVCGVASDATGTVQFYIDGAGWGGPVTVSGGLAFSAVNTNLRPGNHSIYAHYSGNWKYFDEWVGFVQIVNGLTAPAIAAIGNPDPVPQNGNFQFVSSLLFFDPIPPAPAPTGVVQFYVDDVFERSANIEINGGPQNYSALTPFFAADYTLGVHNGRARYTGDSHYGEASTTFQFRVQRVGNAALEVDPNPAVHNTLVTFTATIEHQGGQVPTGTIQVYFNGVPYGGLRTLNGNAQVIFSRSDLVIGSYDVYYHYNGDTRYAALDSEHVDLEVTLTRDYVLGPGFDGYIPYFGDIWHNTLTVEPTIAGEQGAHMEIVIYASHLVLRDGGNNIVYSGGVNCVVSPGSGTPTYSMDVAMWSPLAGGWVSVDQDASYIAFKMRMDDGSFANPLRASRLNQYPNWYNLGDDLCVGQLHH